MRFFRSPSRIRLRVTNMFFLLLHKIDVTCTYVYKISIRARYERVQVCRRNSSARKTCRRNYLRPFGMLLTLTGTRLVDWRAFFVLVVSGATTSGTGKYKIIHDARETGCWRLRLKKDMQIYC